MHNDRLQGGPAVLRAGKFNWNERLTPECRCMFFGFYLFRSNSDVGLMQLRTEKDSIGNPYMVRIQNINRTCYARRGLEFEKRSWAGKAGSAGTEAGSWGQKARLLGQAR